MALLVSDNMTEAENLLTTFCNEYADFYGEYYYTSINYLISDKNQP